MSEATPFSKRIKRHVIGRQHTFFIATTPGLNGVCQDELSALSLPITGVTPFTGGMEFTGRLEDCYKANLFLRTANRVLMRLFEIKATNFRQLAKRIADFHWELYLKPQTQLRFSISAARCRLYHKEAIRDNIIGGIFKRLGAMTETDGQTDPELPVQGIYVRGADDRFTLSLDSSGDILYKRGIKIYGGEAPIRETIAAFALKLAGYSGSVPLIDPMCGSGTFSLEAGMAAAHIPPGWYRDFAFMDWPAFKPRQWEHMKSVSESEFQLGKSPTIFASDIETKAVNVLDETVRSAGLSGNIQVNNRNFFDFHPSELTEHGDGIVVINPPYGIRLETQRTVNKLFGDISKKLTSDYKSWKCILIFPDKELIDRLSFHHSIHPVFHGGLKAYIIVGKI